jgi:hypothetical protein
MTNPHSNYDLQSILKAVRARIEMLEAAASSSKPDKELRRLLKEARIEEAVILAKIVESEKLQ